MIIITGPQATDDERALILDVAQIIDGIPAYAAVLQWATATALYCMTGWEGCPLAVADVAIAESFGLPVQALSV